MGFRSRDATNLAISFATIAKRDAQASKTLYDMNLYANAVFSLQQAVEKDVKAVGILLGLVEPSFEDLARKVNHLSVLGLLVRLPKMLEELPEVQESIKAELDKPRVKETGLSQLLEPVIKPPKVNSETVRAAIKLIRAVDSDKAWKITLDLDPGNEFVRSIYKMLDVADAKWREANEAEHITRRLHTLILRRYGIATNQNSIGFFLNIAARASQEAVPLALLTMWHERRSRYPPIGTPDDWNVEAYTRQTGLIRGLPLFYRHLDRLVTSTLSGARCARNLL